MSNVIFCLKCFSQHQGHNVKAFEDLKDDKTLFPACEEKKQKLLQRIEEQETKANEYLDELKKLISDGFDDIIKELLAKKKEMLDEVEKIKDAKMRIPQQLEHLREQFFRKCLNEGRTGIKCRGSSNRCPACEFKKDRDLDEVTGTLKDLRKDLNEYKFVNVNDFDSLLQDALRLNACSEEYEYQLTGINDLLFKDLDWYKSKSLRIERFNQRSLQEVKEIAFDRLYQRWTSDYHLVLDDKIIGSS